MIKLLNVVQPNAEISADMVVEILAGEVCRRIKEAPRVLIVTMVDRVMAEELVDEDEILRQQVIRRIFLTSEQALPDRIQPKSVMTFLWAICSGAPQPERFQIRAVRHRAKTKSRQLVLIEEPPIPVMAKDGTVIMP